MLHLVFPSVQLLKYFLSFYHCDYKNVLLGFSINMSAKDVLSGGSNNMTAMANATDVLFGFELELLRAQPCWFTLNYQSVAETGWLTTIFG